MKANRKTKALVCLAMITLATAGKASAQATSAWVSMGTCHLQYKTDTLGNRVMDFSSAGYEGGGVPLPVVPAAVTVGTVTGDNTSAIQTAINTVSALPLDAQGFRGAVVIPPGTYDVDGQLNINASGVVLRGSGSGTGGTVLNMPASNPYLLISVAGSGTWATAGNNPAFTDAYVPSGAVSFDVSGSAGFTVGETILIRRPVTAAWVAFMGMNEMPNGDGGYDTWISPGSVILTDRTITAINGNNITIDAPLSDSFDSNYTTGSIIGYTFTGRISQCGVEHLAITAPAVDVVDSSPQYRAINYNAVIDSWVQDVNMTDAIDGLMLDNTAKRITCEGVTITHNITYTFESGPSDFEPDGTQDLFENCASVNNYGIWAFTVQCSDPNQQTRVTGPNVIYNCTATYRGFEPHMRWSTGLLADSCQFGGGGPADQSGIAYSNRCTYGSGHGWDAGFSVAWNVNSTGGLFVENPPGTDNWCIGCTGNEVAAGTCAGVTDVEGVYDSLGTHVGLGGYTSLYLAQIADREGKLCASTPTYSSTATKTPTPTSTPTDSKTPTSSMSPTATLTVAATLTPTRTPSATLTATPTATSTSTASSTAVPATATYTSAPPTATSTSTASSTSTVVPSATASPSATATSTSSPTLTDSATPSSTPSASPTHTNTPVPPTNTPTNTLTSTSTDTVTRTDSTTPTPSATLTATPSASPTRTYTPVPPTVTFTPTFTPSHIFTGSMTATPSLTAGFTQTPTSTPTHTAIPPTDTPTTTSTSTPTFTPSHTFTGSMTATPSLTAGFTRTPSSTPTHTFTPTVTPSSTASGTSLCSGVAAWNGNFVAYATGAKVTYDGDLYQCLQAHTSEPNWEPNVTPALWEDLGACSTVTTAIVYPDPAVTTNTVTLAVPLTQASDVTVKVYSLSFRMVQEKSFANVAVGSTVSLNLIDKMGSKLANGLYYLVSQAQGRTWTVKLLVLH